MDKLDNLIYAMLTENTGRALGDSGDAYGRHWQRNQKRSLEDFRNEPAAKLEISSHTYNDGKVTYYFEPTISLFHKLTSTLDLDELCDEFNALPVEDWDGEYYGTSAAGFEWLENHNFYSSEGFNSYNGDSVLSQVIQGELLNREGVYYVLLQIHNGCDIRGGYTDAKLFRLPEDYALIREDIGFSLGSTILDYYSGDFVNEAGQSLSSDELDALAVEVGCGTYYGDLFE